MDVVGTLKKGRELITDPKHWTQGAYARNEAGEVVASYGQSAVCWCSIGALGKVTYENGLYGACMWVLQSAAKNSSIVLFNDNHSHEEVLAMWDKAIAAEEAKL